jgi:enoyl-CoA hydratase/carnithine racemase
MTYARAMSDADRTVVVSTEGAVATVTLTRPDALNAITREMLVELSVALDALAADDAIRVVVLTGAGRAFSAGVDLKALGQRSLGGGGVGDLLDLPARAAIARLTTIPKVVIARVNGFCFTGALELALACDLIVVAEEAKLGDTHAKWGLRPTWGMSQRLVRAVGVTRARELSYTARTFTGVDAAAWGLAVRAVPLAELDAAVADLAAQTVANSADSLAAYKDLYGRALDGGLADGLAYEAGTRYVINDTEVRIAAFR